MAEPAVREVQSISDLPDARQEPTIAPAGPPDGPTTGSTVFQTAPLLLVALGMMVGVVVDDLARADVSFYVAPFLLATGLLLVPRLRRVVGLIVVFVGAASVGAAWHNAGVTQVPLNSIARVISPEGQIARIRGRVVSPVRIRKVERLTLQRWRPRAYRTVLLMEAEAILGDDGPVAVSGRVRVSVGEAVLGVGDGETVEILGWLRPLSPPVNPGSFDWAKFNRRQRVMAQLSCNLAGNVRRLDSDQQAGVSIGLTSGNRRTRSSHHLVGTMHEIRRRVRGWLIDDLTTGSHQEAGLLSAMIIGHRSKLDRRLNDVFIRAGCAHFLAVSGVHVGIVVLLIRMLGLLMGLSPRSRLLLMILGVGMYGLVIAEPRPSVLRASIIALAYCVGRLLGRERTYLNWISASVIILVLIDPAAVFQVGFQLSFAAVLGVLYLAQALRAVVHDGYEWFMWVCLGRSVAVVDLGRLRDRRRKEGLWIGLWSFAVPIGSRLVFAFYVGLGAWLATLPIVAFHFGMLYPWGAPFSVIVMPLVAVVMGVGFAKILVAAIIPTAASFMQQILSIVDAALLATVEFLSRAPAAVVELPPFTPWLWPAFYLFLLTLVWRIGDGRSTSSSVPGNEEQRKGARRVVVVARGVSLTLVVALVVAGCFSGRRLNQLVITQLAVGAGTATVIELPNGKTIMYDAGSSSPYDVGRYTILPFLRHRGITSLEYVIVSHANLDHFSALPTLLEEGSVGHVQVNQCFEAKSPDRSSGASLLAYLQAKGCSVEVRSKSPASWSEGEVLFERLWPPEGIDDRAMPACGSLSTNDTSTVLRISYANSSILLTGDIEERAQRALLQRGDLGADVLVLPHHGGVRPSTAAFIKAVGAATLIRSSHRQSQLGGRRSSDTGSELTAAANGTPIFNTADAGAVRVAIDAGGVQVDSFLGSSSTGLGF